MPLRLWHRLFLAFALLSIVALAAFAAFQARSFQQGFLSYVNRLERERIEASSQRLARAYARHGDWAFLTGDTPGMLRMLDLGDSPAGRGPPGNAPPRPRDRLRSGPQPPGPPPFGFQDQTPPPPEMEPNAQRPDAPAPDEPVFGTPGPAGPPPWRDAPPGAERPPRPPRLGPNLRPRLLLIDARGDIVAGNPHVPRDAPAIAIVHDGETVGHLLLAPLPRLRSDLDLAFARQQRQRMAWIAVSVLLIALISAWALSRWLLRPVRALAAGTRALASGDYATRIDAARGDEFGALARDFNALAATLEKHRDARRQWGADIAHELRTPISVLSGEIQALQDGVRAVDGERLASLQAECARLRDLVNDLYQLSLSDAGALDYRFEPVDLAEVVREAVQAHTGAMQAAGLSLSAASVPAVCRLERGDRTRLRQLLDNLLGNAMRYTDRPGRVLVALDLVAGGGRLRIDDTAPGVPDEALPHLFERLFRVEPSRSRSFGGAGLGLAICRNIVEAHGGTVAAAHSPEGGLRIEAFLPFETKTSG
ncbi:MAG: HAMP domain-containing protein [Lysobacteraceae bacterium]|nr:MAG: HAMP domain-containing protein [Xanthomonadaceae bacterium]